MLLVIVISGQFCQSNWSFQLFFNFILAITSKSPWSFWHLRATLVTWRGPRRKLWLAVPGPPKAAGLLWLAAADADRSASRRSARQSVIRSQSERPGSKPWLLIISLFPDSECPISAHIPAADYNPGHSGFTVVFKWIVKGENLKSVFEFRLYDFGLQTKYFLIL